MSSSTPRPTVSLDLISTETPLALGAQPIRSKASNQSSTHIALFPGKIGQLRVHMQNHGNDDLEVQLKLQGNFPTEWIYSQFVLKDLPIIAWLLIKEYDCLAGIIFLSKLNLQHREWQNVDQDWDTKVFVLKSKQKSQQTISFKIPENFFENQVSLTSITQKKYLDLRYEGNISLLRISNSFQERELIGYKPINLYIQPTCSYLDFLPEIYQESDFFARVLTIFEHSFDPTIQTMDNFWAYLDPLTAPKALLPFLATAVAWPMNPSWTLKLQRRLIRNAVKLYQWRGSRQGLRFALHLCTGLPNDDAYIQVRDTDNTEFTIGNVTLEEEPILGGGKTFHFSVILRSSTEVEKKQINEPVVREIIEQEKPAFCTYDLEII